MLIEFRVATAPIDDIDNYKKDDLIIKQAVEEFEKLLRNTLPNGHDVIAYGPVVTQQSDINS